MPKRISGTPVPKKKKASSITSLKKKLWAEFSLFIRTRDKFTCFTCGRRGEGSAIHAGHFIPKSIGGNLLYFHEDNVHAQCYNCNINLGGNQYEYGQRLGKETVEMLMRLKHASYKMTVFEYEEKIRYYKEKNT